ncbi:NACHT domain-containing protein [Archangium gephyra]|uniref:NACHT domain-containing protein n=1 Tax=Archangium gephyra TaxID=48 RepID=UPI0035D458A6
MTAGLVKDLLDIKQLLELAVRFGNWVQETGWRSPRFWLVALLMGGPVCYYLLILVPRKLLEGLIGLKESWKKAGFRSLTAEQGEFLRRRSQFCRALRSDFDTLNKAESWNDQFFTDLEADIETDAPFYASLLDKLRRRKTQGLRRVPSLMEAIESSTERWLLLVGEPGSGKSVALRHLAHQLAEQGIHSSDPKARIPLYINLKELNSPPAEGPNADWIRRFVIDNVRRGDADTAEYVKKNWEHHLNQGIWFFLFDSFDEIPAVMHAPIGSTVIENHAGAIRQFLASMNDCRGLIASREFKGPSSLPWHKLRILPLSHERQEELIENTFLSSEEKEIVRRHLLASSSSLRHTPLFLSLLCRFIQQEKRPPVGDHDLLWRHLNRLSERDVEYTQRKHGLTATQLLNGAMELAVLFASSPTLSLSSTHDQIAKTLPPERYTSEQLEHLLAALVDVKIGRSDVPEARKGDRRFTFAHRRYQETLFVRYLATHPKYLSPRKLLLEPHWREYTVALLQSESAEVIAPLLQEASWLLSQCTEEQHPVPCLPGFGEGLGYYQWKEDFEIHLLGLLQEGLARRIGEIPAILSTEVDRLLSSRWAGGDFHDRTMVLRLGGLLPQERLAEYLEFAVKTGTPELQDESFQKMLFLRKPPVPLVRWVRERLGRQVLYAKGRAELLRIEALCARLPETIGAEAIRQRCMALRRPLGPLAALARAWVGVAPPPPILEPFIADTSKEFTFGALLSSLLLVLNAGAIAFGLSAPAPPSGGMLVTVSSWLPALCLLPVTLRYVFRTGRLAPEAGGLGFWSWLLVTLVLLILLMACLTPFVFVFLGLLRQSWLFGGIGGMLVIAVFAFMYWSFTSRFRELERQRARLEEMRSQAQAPEPLAPQAQSLLELSTWLGTHRKVLIPDETHARSLSRLVIHGLELKPETEQVGPPLLVHCVARKWSEEEVRVVFNRLQGP